MNSTPVISSLNCHNGALQRRRYAFEHTEVIATPIVGGLHHEYGLARHAA